MRYWCGGWKDAPGGLQDVIDVLYPFDLEVEASNLRRGLRSDRRGLLRHHPGYQLRRGTNVFCRVAGSDIVGAPGFAPHGGLWVWSGDHLMGERLFDVKRLAHRSRVHFSGLGYLQEVGDPVPGLQLLRSDHPAYTFQGYTVPASVGLRFTGDRGSVWARPHVTWTFEYSEGAYVGVGMYN